MTEQFVFSNRRQGARYTQEAVDKATNKGVYFQVSGGSLLPTKRAITGIKNTLTANPTWVYDPSYRLLGTPNEINAFLLSEKIQADPGRRLYSLATADAFQNEILAEIARYKQTKPATESRSRRAGAASIVPDDQIASIFQSIRHSSGIRTIVRETRGGGGGGGIARAGSVEEQVAKARASNGTRVLNVTGYAPGGIGVQGTSLKKTPTARGTVELFSNSSYPFIVSSTRESFDAFSRDYLTGAPPANIGREGIIAGNAGLGGNFALAGNVNIGQI